MFLPVERDLFLLGVGRGANLILVDEGILP
jgi:hypothetical protein